MIPNNFEVNKSKVKVTVTVIMLTYRQDLVRMITRHRIDLGLSNLAHIGLGSVDDPYGF